MTEWWFYVFYLFLFRPDYSLKCHIPHLDKPDKARGPINHIGLGLHCESEIKFANPFGFFPVW